VIDDQDDPLDSPPRQLIEDVPEGFRTPGMQEALLYAHEAAGEQAAE